MKESENKVYIDLSTGQVMAYKDTLISSQLYALFQDEFIEKLADAIVKKIDERNKDGMSENLQRTCNQLATVAKDTNVPCKDLISRQAAIKTICEDGTWLESQGCTEITMVERKQRDADILGELPSAQPEILACGEGELNVPDINVGDMISRRAAIDALNEVSGNYTGKGDRNWHPHIDFMVQAIEELPSAERKGKWIRENVVLTSNPPQYQWHCSECGRMVHGFTTEVLTKYCPNCGSRNKEEEKE